MPLGVESLVLLRELAPEDMRARKQASSQSPSQNFSEPKLQTAADVLEVEPEELQVGPNELVSMDEPQASTDDFQASTDEIQVSADEPQVSTDEPASIESQNFTEAPQASVDESQASIDEPRADPEELLATVVTAEVPPLRCWELGPLNASVQSSLARLFAGRDLPMRTRKEEITTANDFWVYLAASKREEQDRQRGILDVAGADSYMIAGGELDGALSLGLFTSEQRAESIAGPLRERGLPVQIYLRARLETRTWLTLDSREIEALGWPEDLAGFPFQPRPDIKTLDCENSP